MEIYALMDMPSLLLLLADVPSRDRASIPSFVRPKTFDSQPSVRQLLHLLQIDAWG